MQPDTRELAEFMERHSQECEATPPRLHFSRAEYAERLTRTRQHMQAAGIDTLIATAPESMAYLHGYALRWYREQSPEEWPPFVATVVHVDSDAMIHFDSIGERVALAQTSVLTDIRYYPERSSDPSAAKSSSLHTLGTELAAAGWLTGRVALEKHSHVPYPAYSQAMEEMLRSRGQVVTDGSRILRDVRRRKSDQEIAYIEEAARIADIGLLHLQKVIGPGVTELDMWAELVHAMGRAGSEHAAQHECVVVGNMAIGHMLSSRREIRPGDFVLADPSGVVNRYHANTSRTYFVGDEPPAAAVRLQEIAAGAFDVLQSVARPGVVWTDVNRALREYFIDAGLWDLRKAWIGGYELGLSFPPDWVGSFQFTVADETDERVVEENMVTNFESMLHFPLLDTIVYGKDSTRSLSSLPRTLLLTG